MPPVGPYTPLYERFLDYVRVVRGCAPSTVGNARHYVGLFLAWWLRNGEGLDLDAVRLRHLNDFLVVEAERGMSPATIYAEANLLRVFFGWLVAEEHIAADPTTALVSPRRITQRVDVYSTEEMAAILAATATATDLRGRQRHAIIATLRYTGVRAGEASNLRLERLDLPHRRLEVLGKGRKHRMLAIAAPLAEILERFLAEVRPAMPETPYLFVNRHCLVPDPDLRCSISNLERECRIAGRAAGLPGRHYPHRWRHSLATELIRAGVGVAQVQRQLGHTSVASTMLYTHLHVDDLRDALDGVFGPRGNDADLQPAPRPAGSSDERAGSDDQASETDHRPEVGRHELRQLRLGLGPELGDLAP
jgi:site-specific recombinase XerD